MAGPRIISGARFDPAPPGPGCCTITNTVPGLCSSAPGTVAEAALELLTVVASGVPPGEGPKKI